MSDYAVIGGSGTVGRFLVRELEADGGTARVLSRHSPDHPVDLTTGRGLPEAFTGCSVVIDASNGSPRRPEPVLVGGAQRLIDAALEVGVSRIVCISIVGIENVPGRYYRAKVAQEQIVRASGLSSTIVRSTQFHELLATVFAAFARVRLSPRSAARLQPVAAAEAARAIADVARQPVPPERVNIAGPEVTRVTELARVWQKQAGRRLVPAPLPPPPRLGRLLRDGALTCPAADFFGQTGFESWLSAQS